MASIGGGGKRKILEAICYKTYSKLFAIKIVLVSIVFLVLASLFISKRQTFVCVFFKVVVKVVVKIVLVPFLVFFNDRNVFNDCVIVV
jgi:hypothetical protein